MRRRYFGNSPDLMVPVELSAAPATVSSTIPSTTALPVPSPEEEEQKKIEKLWDYYKAAAWVGRPLAMAFGYYRSKKILTAVGVGFIWLPYLMYVGIDTLGKEKR